MLVNQNAVFLPGPYDAVSSMKTHDQSTCHDVVKEQICTLSWESLDHLRCK